MLGGCRWGLLIKKASKERRVRFLSFFSATYCFCNNNNNNNNNNNTAILSTSHTVLLMMMVMMVMIIIIIISVGLYSCAAGQRTSVVLLFPCVSRELQYLRESVGTAAVPFASSW